MSYLPPVVCRRTRVLFVGGLMFYLRYLCLFTYSGVQHITLCFCFVILRLWVP